MLANLFASLSKPLPIAGLAAYSIIPIPECSKFWLGKDASGRASLIAEHSNDRSGGTPPNIRLELLEVMFALPCQLIAKQGQTRRGTYFVLSCRSLDEAMQRYFLSVCETFVAILGNAYDQRALFAEAQRVASIFQKLHAPATRALAGLYGELLFISRSPSVPIAVRSWRLNSAARFDFAAADARIDIKASTTRSRSHIFSYDQCNPPSGVTAVVVSLYVERIANGRSIGSLIQEIEGQVAVESELLMKVHEVVAQTLGESLSESLDVSFDDQLAIASMRYYDSSEIPGIRSQLPGGVSDVHFRSDISSTQPLSAAELAGRVRVLQSLLAA